MTNALDDRIADAFTSQLSSAELAALLCEVSAAEGAAKKAFAEAKNIAFDPTSRPAAVAAARREMEESEFASIRLSNATVKLQELKAAAQSREAEVEAKRERAAAHAERDDLAAELMEFGQLTNRMVELLSRLTKNNRRLTGHWGRGGAEAIARSLPQGQINEDHVSIITGTKLVAFNGSATWPPTGNNGWVDYP